MMPHIHLLMGILVGLFLKNFGFDNSYILAFIIGSIIPDIDIVLAYYQNKNHRHIFLHFPLFWLSLSFFFLLIKSPFFWVSLGGFFHLVIDLIDWEIFFFAPFWMKGFSILNLDYSEIFENKTRYQSLKHYYSKRGIILIELFIVISLILNILILGY